LVVSVLCKDIRFEPVECRSERNARVSPVPRRQHPERRVFGEPLRVVRVLVPGQAAIDRLAKQVGQRELRVAPGAGIAEMALDQRTQAEALIQLAREEQPSKLRGRWSAIPEAPRASLTNFDSSI